MHGFICNVSSGKNLNRRKQSSERCQSLSSMQWTIKIFVGQTTRKMFLLWFTRHQPEQARHCVVQINNRYSLNAMQSWWAPWKSISTISPLTTNNVIRIRQHALTVSFHSFFTESWSGITQGSSSLPIHHWLIMQKQIRSSFFFHIVPLIMALYALTRVLRGEKVRKQGMAHNFWRSGMFDRENMKGIDWGMEKREDDDPHRKFPQVHRGNSEWITYVMSLLVRRNWSSARRQTLTGWGNEQWDFSSHSWLISTVMFFLHNYVLISMLDASCPHTDQHLTPKATVTSKPQNTSMYRGHF